MKKMRTIKVEILDEESKVMGVGKGAMYDNGTISFNPCMDIPAGCLIREKGTEQRFARDRPGEVWTKAAEGYFEVEVTATTIVHVRDANSKEEAIQFAKDEMNLMDCTEVTCKATALFTSKAIESSRKHANLESESNLI